MSTPKAIEAAAAAIRQEIDVLLTDYAGDQALKEIDGTPSEQAEASARLEAIDWLRETWCRGNGAAEERMITVAEAAMKAAGIAWQPMTTAPKDRQILVFCEGGFGHQIVSWDEDRHEWSPESRLGLNANWPPVCWAELTDPPSAFLKHPRAA